jgi:hypothetical protein
LSTLGLNLFKTSNSPPKFYLLVLPQPSFLSEAVEWHRVVVFGKLAELVKDWVKKGTQVYVEGVLRTRKWQDKGNFC